MAAVSISSLLLFFKDSVFHCGCSSSVMSHCDTSRVNSGVALILWKFHQCVSEGVLRRVCVSLEAVVTGITGKEDHYLRSKRVKKFILLA